MAETNYAENTECVSECETESETKCVSECEISCDNNFCNDNINCMRENTEKCIEDPTLLLDDLIKLVLCIKDQDVNGVLITPLMEMMHMLFGINNEMLFLEKLVVVKILLETLNIIPRCEKTPTQQLKEMMEMKELYENARIGIHTFSFEKGKSFWNNFAIQVSELLLLVNTPEKQTLFESNTFKTIKSLFLKLSCGEFSQYILNSLVILTLNDNENLNYILTEEFTILVDKIITQENEQENVQDEQHKSNMARLKEIYPYEESTEESETMKYHQERRAEQEKISQIRQEKLSEVIKTNNLDMFRNFSNDARMWKQEDDEREKESRIVYEELMKKLYDEQRKDNSVFIKYQEQRKERKEREKQRKEREEQLKIQKEHMENIIKEK